MVVATINIDRDKLLKEMHHETAQLAVKKEGGYDALNLLDSEEKTVYPWIENAISEVTSAVGRYMVEKSWGEETTIVLEMPNNWLSVHDEALSEYAHRFVLNKVTGKWVGMKDKDEAAGYGEAAATALSELVACLEMRKRAARRVRQIKDMNEDGVYAE